MTTGGHGCNSTRRVGDSFTSLIFAPVKQLVADMPGGEDRWQVKPEGIVRVLVNGEVIVENGALTGTRPGRVLRIGNSA